MTMGLKCAPLMGPNVKINSGRMTCATGFLTKVCQVMRSVIAGDVGSFEHPANVSATTAVQASSADLQHKQGGNLERSASVLVRSMVRCNSEIMPQMHLMGRFL